MQRVRIYSGEDGESHFDGLTPETTNAAAALINGPANVEIVKSPVFKDFQPGERKEIAIINCGVHEYGVSDDFRRFFPGDIVVIDDLSGHGHTFEAVGAEPAISMRFPLGDEPAS